MSFPRKDRDVYLDQICIQIRLCVSMYTFINHMSILMLDDNGGITTAMTTMMSMMSMMMRRRRGGEGY